MQSADPRPPNATVPRAVPPPAPPPSGVLPALGALLAAGAVLAAAAIGQQPAIALAIPAAIAAALLCARFPVAAVLGVVVLTATTNTLPAFTPIPAHAAVDALLIGLWLGVAATYATGRAPRSFWLWPALLGPILYLALTVVAALVVEPISYGFTAFRAAAWYMAAALLVAAAPWSRRVHRDIARGLAAVALAIGLYCAYRFVAGPALEETVASRAAQPGLPVSVQARFFGSWLSANELAGWVASVLPFLLALGLAWRGRWRLLAVAAMPLLALALFESDVRAGLAAAAAGIAIVFVLYLVSPAFPGRLGVGIAGVLAAVVIGAAGYAVTVGSSPERAERFTGLFSPGEDEAFSDRLQRWDLAFDEIADEPFGHGLGTAGGVATTNRRSALVTGNLDSSFLKVGLEQGFVVMALYAGSLVILLAALALRATRATDRESATLMIGACGTLAAMLPLFYAGLYSEGVPIAVGWLLVGLGVSQVTIRGQGGTRPRSA